MSVRILLPRISAIGPGALAQLPQLLRAMGCSRPYLMCDGILQQLGVVNRLVEMLAEAGLPFNPLSDLCTEIMPEPT
ncbi:MAG: iron-containing alcohol dehydrogenase, partial [Cellvibrionaceae bacterium]|nr:iron-containing alcohol dehydrogenase [Cellvibrionaceae bacterium]